MTFLMSGTGMTGHAIVFDPILLGFRLQLKPLSLYMHWKTCNVREYLPLSHGDATSAQDVGKNIGLALKKAAQFVHRYIWFEPAACM